ncbi:sulfatase [bacterium]|nr:sulfatase [candidate division CSSED10-310 bacterium]
MTERHKHAFLRIPIIWILIWAAGCSSPEPGPSGYRLTHLVPSSDECPFRSLDQSPSEKDGEPDFPDSEWVIARIKAGGITRNAMVLRPDQPLEITADTLHDARFRASLVAPVDSSNLTTDLRVRIRTESSAQPGTAAERWVIMPRDAGSGWIPVDFDLSGLGPGEKTLCITLEGSGINKSNLPVFIGSPVMISGDPDSRKTSIVMILLDSLRADHLGCYGYPEPVSPFIDRLSRGSVQYMAARSPCSWTMPSVNALFTGIYPSRYQYIGDPMKELPDSMESLAQVLSRNGYFAIGISSNSLIVPEHGFDRGFDVFDDTSVRYGQKNSATLMYSRTVELLKTYRDLPLFLYVHCMDPHDHYAPPGPFRHMFDLPAGVARDLIIQGDSGQLMSRIESAGEIPPDREQTSYLNALYSGEIRCMDAIVEWILRKMQDLGMHRELNLIVTSDHGEEFMDHGRLQHARTLYEESIRIPLLIWKRDRFRSCDLVRGPVSLIDLVPTLMSAANLDIPEGIDGVDIGKPEIVPPERTLFAQLHDLDRPIISWRAAIRGNLKVLQIGSAPFQYYRLDSDPGELSAVSGDPAGFHALAQELGARLDAERNLPRESCRNDEYIEQQLKRLGYIN